MNFLKNRKIELRVLPDEKELPEWEKDLLAHPEPVLVKPRNFMVEEVSEVANDFVTKTAATVLITYTGIRVVNTICKIVEVAAKAKIK